MTRSMSLCLLCAQPMPGDAGICAFHVHDARDDWATGNRVMCDFVHRGIVAPWAETDADTSWLVGEFLDEALSP